MLGLLRNLPRSSRKVNGVPRKVYPLQVRYSSTIAIDFGYTSSSVAVLEGNNPKVVENIEGERSTPCFVAIHPEGNLVGNTARKQAIVNPHNTFYNTKALMGQKHYPELLDTLQLRYKTISNDSDFIDLADESGKTYSVAQVASIVLHRMKETAENNLGSEVSKAIISVPAYFSDTENEVIKEAASLVGLDATLTPEPIAIVLSHKIDKEGTKNYFVFDLGGTRLDMSVVNVNNGLLRIVETKSVATIGGETFTTALVEHIVQTFQDETTIDLRKPEHIVAIQKVSNAAEVAKCELSTTLVNEVNLPFIAANESGPQNLIIKVSRAKLESILEDLVTSTVESMKLMIEELNLNPADMELLVVGGQSKMPKVLEEVEAFFGKKAIRDNALPTPDEAVVMGLHLFVPEVAVEGEETASLTQVPFNIGVETFGGKMDVMIPAASSIPISATRTFTTIADNQQEIEIKLFQGNHIFAEPNLPLGRLLLSGFPNTLKRELKVEVSINVDSNGTVSVVGKELVTRKEDKFTVRSFGGITPPMVGPLVQDAEKAKREEQAALKTSYKSYLDASNELHKLKMVILGQNYLTDGDVTDLLRRIENAQTELEAKRTPDLKPLKDLFSKKMLEKFN
eukprot:TRINITY_DN5134_c0_g1_i1.p1 TRINITY_DN5134_c0_g1~~TRINITY_DN5134_c0_g1_i1.p1  ORF type:complete len:632 (+),score=131.97 TRINITY_DN5134_c0_g1_i1:24-1898(+)